MAKKGSKKSPISKEELFKQQERNFERQFVKEKFFPALVETTKSVDEASMLLQAIVSIIMEEAMETLKTKRMNEIRDRVLSKLDPEKERGLRMEQLILLFDKQTLFKTRSYVEGMKAVIEQMKIDDVQNRTLDTLKLDWDRYLNK